MLLHGARETHILIPKTRCPDLAAVDGGLGFYMIVGNGTAYAYLAELFAACMGFTAGEWIYLPLEFAHKTAYAMEYPSVRHYEGLALINYCALQIGAKAAASALKTRPARVETVDWTARRKTDQPDFWKLKNLLTVKARGKMFLLNGDATIYCDMARSSRSLAEYGDDAAANDFPPHMHYDWSEGTAKSLGVALYYWQNPAILAP